MSNIIKAGSIVKFKSPSNREEGGFYRITSVRGTKSNLGSIFGRCIYFKSVQLDLLEECENEWYS